VTNHHGSEYGRPSEYKFEARDSITQGVLRYFYMRLYISRHGRTLMPMAQRKVQLASLATLSSQISERFKLASLPITSRDYPKINVRRRYSLPLTVRLTAHR